MTIWTQLRDCDDLVEMKNVKAHTFTSHDTGEEFVTVLFVNGGTASLRRSEIVSFEVSP